MKEEGAEDYLVQDSYADGQNLSLPRDVFPNRFQYFLTRHKTLLTAMGLELAICAFAIFLACRTKNEDAIVAVISLTLIFAIFALLTTLIFISVEVHKSTTNRANTIQFMKEIATIRPGIDAPEWDVIAARMNLVFYSSGSLATPYFFYDGESCYSFFKNTYFFLYLRRKNPNGVNAGLVNAGLVNELQPLIDQVLKAYEERINEDWQRVLNEAAVVGNHAMDV